MIIKMREPVSGLRRFMLSKVHVNAKRMDEDFLIETDRGWQKGAKGDWLVEIAGGVWQVISDNQFRRCYDPCHLPGEPIISDRYSGPERRVILV